MTNEGSRCQRRWAGRGGVRREGIVGRRGRRGGGEEGGYSGEEGGQAGEDGWARREVGGGGEGVSSVKRVPDTTTVIGKAHATPTLGFSTDVLDNLS